MVVVREGREEGVWMIWNLVFYKSLEGEKREGLLERMVGNVFFLFWL